MKRTPLTFEEYIALMQTSIITNLVYTIAQATGKPRKEIEDNFAQASFEKILQLDFIEKEEIIMGIKQTYQNNYEKYLAALREKYPNSYK